MSQALFVLVAFLQIISATKSPVIQTIWGPIQGKVEGAVTLFLGVPFAAPPIGENRLRSPQPPKPWTDVLPCEQPKPECAQFQYVDKMPKFKGSEDCLYLDVYVPTSALENNGSKALLPVMQWIYGGGFFSGSISDRTYNGTHIVEKYNVILVAGDYRVGSLGFLALEQLKEESSEQAVGNYGMHDQTAAMQWTKANIQAFGGDPNKVTLFGQSAGGMSVAFHLASPASKGLFQRAIVQSGSGDVKMFFSTYNRTRSFSEDFLRGRGCDGTNSSSADFLKCVRGLSTEKILGDILVNHAIGPGFRPALNPAMPWVMTLDNSTLGLTLSPVDAVRAGIWNKVPVMLGSVANEGSIFVPVLSYTSESAFPLTDKSANKTLLHMFGHNTTVLNAVNQAYPTSGFANNDDRCSMITRDYVFSCALRRLANAISEDHGTAYLYFYTFKDDRPMQLVFGVFHAAEVIYVFDNAPKGNFTVRQQTMASNLGQLWTSFATNAVPTSTHAPIWPAYSSQQDPIMTLDIPSHVQTGFLAKQCAFWDLLDSWNNPDV